MRQPHFLLEEVLSIYSKDPYDYQIISLTDDFYDDYPNPPFKELMRKNTRPYSCLLIQSHYDYFICIPYRSNINHKYSFKFKNSHRSKKAHSGLDFSKIIIINNPKYINSTPAIIDQDEYNETRHKIDYIRHDAQSYIENYINFFHNPSNYDFKEFSRIYKFSSLQYFHKELNIKKRTLTSHIFK